MSHLWSGFSKLLGHRRAALQGSSYGPQPSNPHSGPIWLLLVPFPRQLQKSPAFASRRPFLISSIGHSLRATYSRTASTTRNDLLGSVAFASLSSFFFSLEFNRKVRTSVSAVLCILLEYKEIRSIIRMMRPGSWPPWLCDFPSLLPAPASSCARQRR